MHRNNLMENAMQPTFVFQIKKLKNPNKAVLIKSAGWSHIDIEENRKQKRSSKEIIADRPCEKWLQFE